jgi:hypothetical protein
MPREKGPNLGVDCRDRGRLDKTSSRLQVPFVNATRARRRIRELVRAGRVRFTDYAALRMLQRGVGVAEVFRLLASAQSCHAQSNGRWRLAGQDLTVVVELSENAIVVTLFRGDENGDEDEEG